MTGALVAAVVSGLVARGLLPDAAAWFAFTPLALSIVGEPAPLRAAGLSAVGHLGLLVVAFEGAIPAIPWTFPVAILLALPWTGLPGLMTALCARRLGPQLALGCLPFTWVAAEFLVGRVHLWGSLASPVSLAYTQTERPLMAAASIAGTAGVTFLVMLLNCSLASAVLLHRAEPLLVPLGLYGLGMLALPPSSPSSGTTSVAIVQPRITPSW